MSYKRTVSIILPTYNRAAFLPQAFASIRAQTFTDWELIIVDDGSTDETEAIVRRWSEDSPQPIRYLKQANQGPYAARNTGLELASGEYVAFFDSDDVWLPHHLTDCVEALQAHSEVDWVYGACRMVDLPSQRELSPNTFYDAGQPRPFLKLHARPSGNLRILDDERTLATAIVEGLYCGLQNSLIRHSFFEGRRFVSSYRNEAEDQLIVIRALAAGCRFAYVDKVHVIYHVHDSNSSASAVGASLEKKLRIYEALIRGFEELRAEVPMAPASTRALKRRLSCEYFWKLGYAVLWQNGRRAEALKMFRCGLRLWPWDWRYWKTYVGALIRSYA